jgi:hypothetical protein
MLTVYPVDIPKAATVVAKDRRAISRFDLANR